MVLYIYLSRFLFGDVSRLAFPWDDRSFQSLHSYLYLYWQYHIGFRWFESLFVEASNKISFLPHQYRSTANQNSIGSGTGTQPMHLSPISAWRSATIASDCASRVLLLFVSSLILLAFLLLPSWFFLFRYGSFELVVLAGFSTFSPFSFLGLSLGLSDLVAIYVSESTGNRPQPLASSFWCRLKQFLLRALLLR